jgi:hypothetical protein
MDRIAITDKELAKIGEATAGPAIIVQARFLE